jgi:hypothetical protein
MQPEKDNRVIAVADRTMPLKIKLVRQVYLVRVREDRVDSFNPAVRIDLQEGKKVVLTEEAVLAHHEIADRKIVPAGPYEFFSLLVQHQLDISGTVLVPSVEIPGRGKKDREFAEFSADFYLYPHLKLLAKIGWSPRTVGTDCKNPENDYLSKRYFVFVK